MNLLVTSVAGYISAVNSEIIRVGSISIVFVNLAKWYQQAINAEALFVHGDPADREKLDELIYSYRVDAVIRLAMVDPSVRTPTLYRFSTHHPHLLDDTRGTWGQ